MKYRRLGKSGLQVSMLGLGGNRFGAEKMPQAEVNRVIAAAQDAGINFIDTANMYTNGRSEETLGVALKERREKFVLATKVGHAAMDEKGMPNRSGASRYHIVSAVEASLRRLQTERIDLYYIHIWDENTPVEETLRALDDLVRSGKVLYLGASNFAAWQLAHANVLAELSGWTPFIAIQNEFNLFFREQSQEMLPYCAAHQVGFIPYFPLAGGLLTGKYRRGEPYPAGSRYDDIAKRGGRGPYDPQEHWDQLELLSGWAEQRGHSLTELAFAWLLGHHQVASIIGGVTRLAQLYDNVKAVDWDLSPQEMAEVSELLEK